MTDKTYHICIYGDSNSWGFLDDGSGIRYEARWPVVMADKLSAELGAQVKLVEECLPGRTTAYPDSQEGPEYNGLPYLKPALLSHAPLDIIVIMLGTNDAKKRFQASADSVSDNLVTLAKIARRAPVGHGKWREGLSPKVMIIAPANLGKRANNPDWPRYEEWQGGSEMIAQLPDMLKAKLAAINDKDLYFADANEAVAPSEQDPIHWSKASHHQMGQTIAKYLTTIL